jgi:uncharacterized protein
MTTKNARIVEAIFTALGAGDLAAAAAHFHSDVVIHEPPSLPYGGVFKGHEGFLDLFQRLATCYDNLSISPSAIADAGPFVMALTTLNGRSRTTGAEISMPLCEVFVVRDGKIADIRPFYWDTAATVEVLRECGGGSAALIPHAWDSFNDHESRGSLAAA